MYRASTTLPDRDRSDLSTLRALLPYVWTYRGRSLLAILCLVVAKLANQLSSFLLRLLLQQRIP